VDAKEKKSKAMREQETREVQQERKRQHSPERQKRSEVAHGQENWKV